MTDFDDEGQSRTHVGSFIGDCLVSNQIGSYLGEWSIVKFKLVQLHGPGGEESSTAVLIFDAHAQKSPTTSRLIVFGRSQAGPTSHRRRLLHLTAAFPSLWTIAQLPVVHVSERLHTLISYAKRRRHGSIGAVRRVAGNNVVFCDEHVLYFSTVRSLHG